jgi:hypothetical protein
LSESEQSAGLPADIVARFKSEKEKEQSIQGVLSILVPVVTVLLAIGSPVFFYIGIALYVVTISIVFVIQRSFRDRKAYFAITRCITAAEKAEKTMIGSRERLQLGKSLLACAGRIRKFGSRVPVRLPERIMSAEAKRCSRQFRHLNYPAILGTDEELDQIEKFLECAALKAGTGNWLQIRNLEVEVADYPAVRSAPEWLSVTTLLPVAATLLPALITVLVRS